MKKNLIALNVPLIFIFLILIFPVAGYEVSISDLNSNTSSNTVRTDGPSWFVDSKGGSCSVSINGQGSVTGTNFEFSGSFQSPGETIIANFGPVSGQDTFTCRDLGTTSAITATGGNGTLEARTVLSHTGTSSFLQTINQLSCTSGGESLEFFIDNTNFTTFDDKGFLANLVRGSSTVETLTPADFSRNVTICQDPTSGPVTRATYSLFTAGTAVGCSGNNICSDTYIFTFNSSDSGAINIFFNATAQCTNGFPTSGAKNAELTLVRRSTLSEEILNPLDLVCSLAPGTLNEFFLNVSKTGLVPNEIYDLHFFMSKAFGSGDDVGTLRIQFANISIDSRVGNFVCDEFTNCTGGIQTRLCTDTTGQFPDVIEAQSCTQPSNFSELILGFEELNTTTLNILECKKNAFTCAAFVTNISIELPVGWNINFESVNDSGVVKPHEAMAFMTTEEAFEGFRSLELNYRPPKLDVVTESPGNPAICANATSGFQGSVDTVDLNATIESESFLFPGDFPALRWATLKANNSRLQYDVNFLGANPFCSPKTLCYGDCNATVRGTYSVTLFEEDNFGNIIRTVFRFEGEATNQWGVVNVDLNASQINATGPHRIRISTFVAGEDISDIRPKRLFFDNFSIQNLVLPLVEDCTSLCIGPDLRKATLQNDTCFIVTIINESSCVAIVQAEAEAAAQQIFEPIEFLAEAVNVTFVRESGFGFTLFFLSPFFIVFIVLLSLSALIEIKISKAGATTGGSVFGLVMLAGSLGLTLAGLFPLAFAIIFIILGGLLVANKFNQLIRGSG